MKSEREQGWWGGGLVMGRGRLGWQGGGTDRSGLVLDDLLKGEA